VPRRILAIANQKGGVGKTTTTINLAACLAAAGRKTLVIDLDPQSNTTSGLGVDPHTLANSATIYEVLVTNSAPARSAIKDNIVAGVSLLPAKVDLYAADIELVYMDQREYRLKHAIEPLRDQFDYILIDCPPSLGLLTVNALTLADGVILPLQCEYFALEGLQQLLNTIKLVRDRLNPNIVLFGVLLTMYDSRTNLANEIVKDITSHFPNDRFKTIVPRNVRLAEAPSYGKTIIDYDPRSPGGLAYKDLAEEVIARAEQGAVNHA
jgi:chromosome partitioning protein